MNDYYITYLHAILLLLALVRNSLIFYIRGKWIEDIHENRVNGDGSLEWKDLPDYYLMLINFRVWRYVPLKRYLNK